MLLTMKIWAWTPYILKDATEYNYTTWFEKLSCLTEIRASAFHTTTPRSAREGEQSKTKRQKKNPSTAADIESEQ